MMFLQNLWEKHKRRINKSLSFLCIALLIFYKTFLSIISGSGGFCRFYPSCSEYALRAYQRRPFFQASWLVLKRLLACRPFGPKVREESLLKEFEAQKRSF